MKEQEQYPHHRAIAIQIADDTSAEVAKIAPHVIGGEGLADPFGFLMELVAEELGKRANTSASRRKS